jgi:membrane protease YdiL (CAAX protease family)
MGTQVLFQWGAMALEIILNMFGLSFLSGIESATGGSDTFSMFLYIGFGAPIAEELLFRGLVLRSLQPMGKKIAIFMSAVMFGLYHANAIQIPYAFLVGLVLGYVAIEYSIGWAMLLHMFNNLILADTLPRILPGLGGNLLTMAITYTCLLVAVIVLLVKMKSIIAYLRENKGEPGSIKAFFTAPGMIVFFVVIFAMTIFTTAVLIGPVA